MRPTSPDCVPNRVGAIWYSIRATFLTLNAWGWAILGRSMTSIGATRPTVKAGLWQSRAMQAHHVECERLDERHFVEFREAAGGAEMSRRHACDEQDPRIICLHLPQFGDPFCGFPILDAWVADPGGHQHV